MQGKWGVVVVSYHSRGDERKVGGKREGREREGGVQEKVEGEAERWGRREGKLEGKGEGVEEWEIMKRKGREIR